MLSPTPPLPPTYPASSFFGVGVGIGISIDFFTESIPIPRPIPTPISQSGTIQIILMPLLLRYLPPSPEIFHSRLEYLLVFIAVDVLRHVLSFTFGVSHLPEHPSVGAGDALDGVERPVGVGIGKG